MRQPAVLAVAWCVVLVATGAVCASAAEFVRSSGRQVSFTYAVTPTAPGAESNNGTWNVEDVSAFIGQQGALPWVRPQHVLGGDLGVFVVALQALTNYSQQPLDNHTIQALLCSLLHRQPRRTFSAHVDETAVITWLRGAGLNVTNAEELRRILAHPPAAVRAALNSTLFELIESNVLYTKADEYGVTREVVRGAFEAFFRLLRSRRGRALRLAVLPSEHVLNAVLLVTGNTTGPLHVPLVPLLRNHSAGHVLVVHSQALAARVAELAHFIHNQLSSAAPSVYALSSSIQAVADKQLPLLISDRAAGVPVFQVDFTVNFSHPSPPARGPHPPRAPANDSAWPRHRPRHFAPDNDSAPHAHHWPSPAPSNESAPHAHRRHVPVAPWNGTLPGNFTRGRYADADEDEDEDEKAFARVRFGWDGDAEDEEDADDNEDDDDDAEVRRERAREGRQHRQPHHARRRAAEDANESADEQTQTDEHGEDSQRGHRRGAAAAGGADADSVGFPSHRQRPSRGGRGHRAPVSGGAAPDSATGGRPWPRDHHRDGAYPNTATGGRRWPRGDATGAAGVRGRYIPGHHNGPESGHVVPEDGGHSGGSGAAHSMAGEMATGAADSSVSATDAAHVLGSAPGIMSAVAAALLLLAGAAAAVAIVKARARKAAKMEAANLIAVAVSQQEGAQPAKPCAAPATAAAGACSPADTLVNDTFIPDAKRPASPSSLRITSTPTTAAAVEVR